MNSDSELDARLRRAASAAAPDLDDAVLSGAASRRPARRVTPAPRYAVLGSGLVVVVGAALVVSSTIAPSGPLFTLDASAAGTAGFETQAAQGTATDLAAVDVMYPSHIYDYVAGEGLSAQGGRGTVYELQLPSDPEQALRDIAEVFGVDGEPQQPEWPAWPFWMLGDTGDGSATIMLDSGGGGSWHYNDPSAYGQTMCPQSAPVVTPEELQFFQENPEVAEEAGIDLDGIGLDDIAPELMQSCETILPEGAVPPPGRDEARRIAQDLFARTGLSVPLEEIDYFSDEWQTTATASLVVDGQKTALQWSIGWTDAGLIGMASGSTAQVVARGAFDTVPARDAVGRLDDGSWGGTPGPDYPGRWMGFLAAGAVTTDGVATADDSAAVRPGDDVVESPPVPGDEPEPMPLPVEPMPLPAPGDPEPTPGDPSGDEPDAQPTETPGGGPSEPERLTVVLEHAEATLLMVWDLNGGAWLVPGYAMELPDDGGWVTAISVVEGVIGLPER